MPAHSKFCRPLRGFGLFLDVYRGTYTPSSMPPPAPPVLLRFADWRFYLRTAHRSLLTWICPSPATVVAIAESQFW